MGDVYVSRSRIVRRNGPPATAGDFRPIAGRIATDGHRRRSTENTRWRLPRIRIWPRPPRGSGRTSGTLQNVPGVDSLRAPGVGLYRRVARHCDSRRRSRTGGAARAGRQSGRIAALCECRSGVGACAGGMVRWPVAGHSRWRSSRPRIRWRCDGDHWRRRRHATMAPSSLARWSSTRTGANNGRPSRSVCAMLIVTRSWSSAFIHASVRRNRRCGSERRTGSGLWTNGTARSTLLYAINPPVPNA